MNLVAFLNYRSTERPSLDVFKGREWMRLYFGKWNGKQLSMWIWGNEVFERENLIDFGTTDLASGDPVTSDTIGRWTGIVERLEIVSRLTEITSNVISPLPLT